MPPGLFRRLCPVRATGLIQHRAGGLVFVHVPLESQSHVVILEQNLQLLRHRSDEPGVPRDIPNAVGHFAHRGRAVHRAVACERDMWRGTIYIYIEREVAVRFT